MNEDQNKNFIQYLNNAQYFIAVYGDVFSRVCFYLAMNKNFNGENKDTNQEIAKSIGCEASSVKRAISKLRKLQLIHVYYDHNDLISRRTISYLQNFNLSDIRNHWGANNPKGGKSAHGVVEDKPNPQSKKAQDPGQISPTLNNTSLNTTSNTSFNNEKEEYKKINKKKIKK